MPKSADVRINETMQQIVPAFPRNGARLKDAMQLQLMRNYSQGPGRESLSAAISLEGFHIGGDQRRKMERLYLLALATVGGKKLPELRAEKKGADRLNEEQIKARIQELADKINSPPAAAGTLKFAESFDYAPAAAREQVEKAVIKARRILAAMYQGLKAGSADAGERKRYVTWFGAVDAGRVEKVRANIEAVYQDVTTRPLKIYYRGLGVDGMPDDQPGTFYHNDVVKLRTEIGLYGCFIPGWPSGSTETDHTHILLGGAFFAKCQLKSDPVDMAKMSGAGVIIHELLHAVCGAKDEKNQQGEVLYGPRKCLAAAIALPGRAINNADSYRLFSDQYDTD